MVVASGHPSLSRTSASSDSLGRLIASTMAQKAGVLAAVLRIEIRNVESAQIGGDVFHPSVAVPSPKCIPVARSKISDGQIAPRHIMPSIVCGKIEPVGFVVARHDDGASVDDIMFFQILFVDSHDVRRRCDVSFG